MNRLTSLPALLLLTLAAGCDGTQGPEDESSASAASLESAWVPATAPQGTTYLRTRANGPVKAVHYADVDGTAVFEGDILLGRTSELSTRPGDVSAQGVAVTGTRYRWANALVPYDIASDLANTTRVTNAIKHWQERTRVRFVLRTSANAQSYPNYITFRTSTGCSSSVGMRGGQQFVNLATGCSTGNTIHEIGHALGLWHEQSREDRNSFVTINFQNIQAGYEGNFNQQISNGDDLGAYDYGSIMHYDARAFSANGQPTITVLKAGVTIGQRSALSSGDLQAIGTLYPAPTLAPGVE